MGIIFYAFWLPVAGALPAWGHLAFWVILGTIAFTVPRWWRPKDTTLPASYVEEQRCTACSTCYEDCPFDAISMVVRDEPSTLSHTVARVDPALCVSCGSCSAMRSASSSSGPVVPFAIAIPAIPLAVPRLKASGLTPGRGYFAPCEEPDGFPSALLGCFDPRRIMSPTRMIAS